METRVSRVFFFLHVDSSFSMLFESLSPVLISFCPGTQSMRKCVRSATWGPLGASWEMRGRADSPGRCLDLLGLGSTRPLLRGTKTTYEVLGIPDSAWLHSQRCNFSVYPFQLPTFSSYSKPVSCQWGIPDPTVRNMFQIVPDLGQKRYLINVLTEWTCENSLMLPMTPSFQTKYPGVLWPLLTQVVRGATQSMRLPWTWDQGRTLSPPKSAGGEIRKKGKRVWPGHTNKYQGRQGGAEGRAREWKGQGAVKSLTWLSWLQLQSFQKQMAWEGYS